MNDRFQTKDGVWHVTLSRRECVELVDRLAREDRVLHCWRCAASTGLTVVFGRPFRPLLRLYCRDHREE